MSSSSNRGIILAANNDGSSGNLVLPNAGSLASPLQVSIDVSERVVLTLVFGFNAVTSYTVRVRLKNSNKYGTLAAGKAAPALTGGAVDANLNVPVPVLSVAQNDSNPGVYQIDHVYTPGLTTDFIELAGGLIGQIAVLDALLTTAGGAPAAGDFAKISVDAY